LLAFQFVPALSVPAAALWCCDLIDWFMRTIMYLRVLRFYQ